MTSSLTMSKHRAGKHRGKFNWKKFSKYRGNLREYWEMKERLAEHRRD